MSDSALQKYLQAQFIAREADVAVRSPESVEFFGKVWRVRGLTGPELARSREASERDDNLKALVAAMAGAGDKAEAIRTSMGLNNDDVPGDISRRIEMLAAGSVNPKLGPDNRDVAVKLTDTDPTLFYELTNKILSLTGSGKELGKSRRSTKTPASG
jgi:hypothetical protein